MKDEIDLSKCKIFDDVKVIIDDWIVLDKGYILLRKSVEMAKSLYALKVSIETIAKAANLTVGEVESIINS